MNGNREIVQTEFAPEVRFAVTPAAGARFRGALETEFKRLKDRLLRQWLRETPHPEFNRLVRRAANEAAGLARLTPYPLLVFPALFEEKTAAAVKQERRQARVHRHSLDLLARAV